MTKLNGDSFVIVGVMPASLAFVQKRYDIWVPIAFTPQDAERGSHSFFAAARLKPGVSFDTAKSELRTIAGRLEIQYESNKGESDGAEDLQYDPDRQLPLHQ